MQHAMYKTQCFEYEHEEAEKICGVISMQVCSRENRSNGVGRTWWLGFAYGSGLRVDRRRRRHENGPAASWIRAFVGCEDGPASLVAWREGSFVRDEYRLATRKFGACAVVAVGVRRAPEWQLWWRALTVVWHVDGTTTRSQEWAWFFEVGLVEWCSAAAIIGLLLVRVVEMRPLQRHLEIFSGKGLRGPARVLRSSTGTRRLLCRA
jgi:hypothetical protein